MAKRFLALLLTITGLSLLSAGTAFAAEESGARFSITPIDHDSGYFTLTLEPGESAALTVEIANHGDEPGDALTFAADLYTIPNGGFSARLHGEPISGPTEWLSYPEQTVALGAGQAIQQSFAIAVPSDALPGEYLAGLVVQGATPTHNTDGGNLAVNQVQRRVVAVFVTVPGDLVPALSINGMDHEFTPAGRSVISVGVSNTGTRMTRGGGEFVLWDAAGVEVTRHAVTTGTYYAGDTAPILINFQQPLLPGDYTATLDLAYGDLDVASGVMTVTVEEPPAPRSSDGSPLHDVADVIQDAAFGGSGGGPWASLAGGAGIALLGFIGFRGFRSWAVDSVRLGSWLAPPMRKPMPVLSGLASPQSSSMRRGYGLNEWHANPPAASHPDPVGFGRAGRSGENVFVGRLGAVAIRCSTPAADVSEHGHGSPRSSPRRGGLRHGGGLTRRSAVRRLGCARHPA